VEGTASLPKLQGTISSIWKADEKVTNNGMIYHMQSEHASYHNLGEDYFDEP
jgi:hypothetical protein